MMLQIDKKTDSLGQLSLQLVVMPIAVSCLLILVSPIVAKAGYSDQMPFGAGIIVALLAQSALAWFALQRNLHLPLRRLVDYLREVRKSGGAAQPPETAGILRDITDLTRDVVQSQIMIGHYVVSIHAIEEVTQAVRTVARTAKAELTGIAHATSKLAEDLNENSGQLSRAFTDIQKTFDAEKGKLDRMREANVAEVETVRLAPVMFENVVARFEERANALLKSIGKDPRLVAELENLARAVTCAGVELKENGAGLAEVRSAVNSVASQVRPTGAILDRLAEMSESIVQIRNAAGTREAEAVKAAAAELKETVIDIREQTVTELAKIRESLGSKATREDVGVLDGAVRQANQLVVDGLRDMRGLVASQAASAVETIVERTKGSIAGAMEPVLSDLRGVARRVEPLDGRITELGGSVSQLATTATLDHRLSELQRALLQKDATKLPLPSADDMANLYSVLSHIGAQLDAVSSRVKTDAVIIDGLQLLRDDSIRHHASLAELVERASKTQQESASETHLVVAKQLENIEVQIASVEQRTVGLDGSLVETGRTLQRLSEAQSASLADSRERLARVQDELLQRLDIAGELTQLLQQGASTSEAVRLLGQQVVRATEAQEHAVGAIIADSDAKCERLSARAMESRAGSESAFLNLLSRIEGSLTCVSDGLNAVDATSSRIAHSLEQNRAFLEQIEIVPRFDRLSQELALLSRDLADSRRLSEARVDSMSQELGDHVAEALRRLAGLAAGVAEQAQTLDRLSSAQLQPMLAAAQTIQGRLGELAERLGGSPDDDVNRMRLHTIEQTLGQITHLLGLVEQQLGLTSRGVADMAGELGKALTQQERVASAVKDEVRLVDERLAARIDDGRAAFDGGLARIDQRFAAVDGVAQAVDEIAGLLRAHDVATTALQADMQALALRVEDKVTTSASDVVTNCSRLVGGLERQTDEAVTRLMNAILAARAAVSEGQARPSDAQPAFAMALGPQLADVGSRLDIVLDRLDDQLPHQLDGLVENLRRDQSAFAGRVDQIIDRLQLVHTAVAELAGRANAVDSAVQPIKDGVQSLSQAQARMLTDVSRQVTSLAETMSGMPQAFGRHVQHLAGQADVARIDSRLGELSVQVTRILYLAGDDQRPGATGDLGIGANTAIAKYPLLREVTLTSGGGAMPHAPFGAAAGLSGRLDEMLDRLEDVSETIHRGLAEVRTMLSSATSELQPNLIGLRLEIIRHLTEMSSRIDAVKTTDRAGQFESAMAAMARQFADFKDFATGVAQGSVREVMAGVHAIPSGRRELAEICDAIERLQAGVESAVAGRQELTRWSSPGTTLHPVAAGHESSEVGSRLDDIVLRLDRIYDGLETREQVWPRTAVARQAIEIDVQPLYDKIRLLSQFADSALVRTQHAMASAADVVAQDNQSRHDGGAAIEQLSHDLAAVLSRFAEFDRKLQAIAGRIEQLPAGTRSEDIGTAFVETMLECEARIESSMSTVRDELKSFGDRLDSTKSAAVTVAGPVEAGAYAHPLSPSMTTVLKLMSGFTSAIEDRFNSLEGLLSGQLGDQDEDVVKTFNDSLAAMRKLTDEFLDISSAISSELSSHLDERPSATGGAAKRTPDLRRTRR
ncbi:hypothetical protein BRADO1280 [Bradyrhizobium sp. ORS 278]|uniref:hypothetical protein n=1 Tax=Bradyrhizobium sp. (strain ORS 278) TaxID=114615 RepID=UPI0001507DA8|nr:hypothetical protein [Bradyrhizobium sp. ORS 278]CAL75182.1 hypothetical protein BRADO1280 [Bradyrhizobium sp. ORS 278]